MTSAEIIEEIKRLPLDEQNRVVEFVQKTRGNLALSPEELGDLSRQMVDAKNPAEADRIQKEIVRGFYGSQSHA
ncbi:MAG TPA: hypothetical protein VNV43_11850 [Candidatus Acidoferrales bacterium]|jgi:hypothetical protein|nr:hypothetical protein [Candidatus Acidoferrales bacterium]